MTHAPPPRSPGARSPVLADVAARAGVSHQTVSRVVNGHPSVAPSTRERVQQAIDDLGYRPNTAARALVTRRSHRIGVVTTATSHYGPTATLLGVEEAARAAGYAVSVTILSSVDDAGMRTSLEHLRRQGVDGVVVIAPQDAARDALASVDPHLPLVEAAVDEEVGREVRDEVSGEHRDERGDVLAAGQVRGARLATAHLLGLGHLTVHHVSGPPDWREARARRTGWQAELDVAGVAAPPAETGDWTPRSGYDAGRRLLRRTGVTAVFVANDQMALGLMRAAAEAGVRVPEDVSVVGYDDLPEAPYLSPPLTTVRLDAAERGRRCVADLLAILSAPDPLTPRAPESLTRALTPVLIVRASTAPPRRLASEGA